MCIKFSIPSESENITWKISVDIGNYSAGNSEMNQKKQNKRGEKSMIYSCQELWHPWEYCSFYVVYSVAVYKLMLTADTGLFIHP